MSKNVEIIMMLCLAAVLALAYVMLLRIINNPGGTKKHYIFIIAIALLMAFSGFLKFKV
jgi:hypothetical protein